MGIIHKLWTTAYLQIMDSADSGSMPCVHSRKFIVLDENERTSETCVSQRNVSQPLYANATRISPRILKIGRSILTSSGNYAA